MTMMTLNKDSSDPSLTRPSVLWLGMDLETSPFNRGRVPDLEFDGVSGVLPRSDSFNDNDFTFGEPPWRSAKLHISDGTASSFDEEDYNFLDYNEKVIDGFYDVFGLSAGSSGQGKIPSLAELQMSIGDLGYEVIVVDYKFDNALQEMKEVAECCLLGCPDTTILVRRIAEVVADHMGGPVIDANEMITRWLSKSIEQRTSHQTSLLHIGSIEIGLSRHRALLFKILADIVGIPCKLVKGSHYTGVEDDAINIIKMDDKSCVPLLSFATRSFSC
ncbi:hypothetical protein TRIUR3_18072 [Triticum urartu]|uniref:EDR1/CTR1/ARMC3-like peptidase-like domain-containing protein n=1 Tax=Triticum urartu TaxID=4572 RepID=M7YMM0_TRIUA|nr:hypothetical protein TRIUR3_18072 [Triticum urartu]